VRFRLQQIHRDDRSTGPWRRCWLGILLWVLSIGPVSAADAPTVAEVRALYLYNFSLFISWPESAFSSPDAPIVYCVEGNARLSKILAKLLDGESVHGRPLRLARDAAGSNWSGCHLLYLASTLGDQVASIRRTLQGRPMLLVSDSQGRRVRPMINLEAVKASGIRISSKLLRLSTLVSTDEG